MVHHQKKNPTFCCGTSQWHLPGCPSHGRCRYCLCFMPICRMIGKCIIMHGNPKRISEHDNMIEIILKNRDAAILKAVSDLQAHHSIEKLDRDTLQRISKLKEAYTTLRNQDPTYDVINQIELVCFKLKRMLSELKKSQLILPSLPALPALPAKRSRKSQPALPAKRSKKAQLAQSTDN